MAYAIPVISFLLPLIFGLVAAGKGRRGPILILGAALLAVFLWAWVMGQRTRGWDGIGYAIVAVLGATPALAGLALGTLIGWLKRRRARTRAAPPDP